MLKYTLYEVMTNWSVRLYIFILLMITALSGSKERAGIITIYVALTFAVLAHVR